MIEEPEFVEQSWLLSWEQIDSLVEQLNRKHSIYQKVMEIYCAPENRVLDDYESNREELSILLQTNYN